jgi:hypothetical protein
MSTDDVSTRLLAALPCGVARPLRWILHRAGLAHGIGTAAAHALVEAGRLETTPGAKKADWSTGTVLLRRVSG